MARGWCSRHYNRWRLYGDPLASDRRNWGPRDLRFWALVERGEGCWPWRGYSLANGYGGFEKTTAHRVAYELSIGPIPEGLHLDHLCRNRLCVRPDHLEPVTPYENLRRGSRMQSDTCKNGHPLAGDNLYTRTGARGPLRYCRKCRAQAEARRRKRLAAEDR